MSLNNLLSRILWLENNQKTMLTLFRVKAPNRIAGQIFYPTFFSSSQRNTRQHKTRKFSVSFSFGWAFFYNRLHEVIMIKLRYGQDLQISHFITVVGVHTNGRLQYDRNTHSKILFYRDSEWNSHTLCFRNFRRTAINFPKKLRSYV